MRASERQIPGFTRDTSLSSDIADSFGGGAARAEQMIDANAMRFSDELNEANLHVEDVDARDQFSAEDVEDVADLPEGSVLGVTKRGNFLVYVYEVNDRVLKDALVIDGDKLVAPEQSDSPERQALRAAAKSAQTVKSAQQDAAQIIADAKEEAARLIAEAAQEAEEQRAKDAEDAAKAAAKKADADAKKASEPARTGDKPAPKATDK